VIRKKNIVDANENIIVRVPT